MTAKISQIGIRKIDNGFIVSHVKEMTPNPVNTQGQPLGFGRTVMKESFHSDKQDAANMMADLAEESGESPETEKQEMAEGM